MAFVQNNIRFRSVAAKSLEYFYNSKAFMLNDLILEKNQFSEVARESLLLLFNSFSLWASEVEYLMLNKPVIGENEINVVVERIEKIHRSHCNIFDIHTDVFVPKFISVWQDAHTETRNAFVLQVRKATGESQLEAYPLIINALVTMLQSTMYELYEIDCLLGSNFVVEQCTANRSNTNRLVAYVDNFALDYYKATGIFLLSERIRQYLLVSCGTLPLAIKNYSSEVITFSNGLVSGDEPLASLLRLLQEDSRIELLEIVSVPPNLIIN